MQTYLFHIDFMILPHFYFRGCSHVHQLSIRERLATVCHSMQHLDVQAFIIPRRGTFANIQRRQMNGWRLTGFTGFQLVRR